MTCATPRSMSLLSSLRAALASRREELDHASALGRRDEVLEDICVQLLHEAEGLVPDWEDPRLQDLLAEALRLLGP